MSRHHSHINTAINVLSKYDGRIPFAQELKQFFSGQKKYGSKDRRQIRHLCYCYFRAARVLKKELSLEEKVLQGYFLCSSASSPLLAELKPEWVELAALPLEEKLEKLDLRIENLFPNSASIEESIDALQFSYLHFEQPDLFLRIRPQQEQKVKGKLDKASISYKQIGADCLALPNNTRVEEQLYVNWEAVVQDYASQRVGGMLELVKEQLPSAQEKLKVWDCCAASGGKTILANDKLGAVELTLSDNRKSMLHNLKGRLKQARIKGYQSKLMDLTDLKLVDGLGNFDLIIADVPCSGSGTWGRTPERLTYFDTTEIESYAKLQKNIVSNIQTKLKPGAFLLYITCSVYKQENSEVVRELVDDGGLELVKSEVYSGIPYKSDTMFAALLRKS